jgi:hypothetical protein
MKKILFLFFVIVLLPIGAFATCSGDDIGTDYWGKTHGCACNGGGVDEQKSRGNEIISRNPGKRYQCRGCWLFCNDRWVEDDGGWCPSDPTLNSSNSNLVIVMNETKKCWTKRCPEGSYFAGSETGSVNYSNCVRCNGLSQTIAESEGVCWDILCGENETKDSLTKGKKFGFEVVIYNGKCMPVCDVQTAGAIYDANDSTYISIKIKSKNAGEIGKSN